MAGNTLQQIKIAKEEDMDQKYPNSAHILGMNECSYAEVCRKKVMSIFSGTVDIHAKTHFKKLLERIGPVARIPSAS